MVSLKNILIFGKENYQKELGELQELSNEVDLKVVDFDSLVAQGKQIDMKNELEPAKEPTTDDVLMLSYTSGTTGMPKGVQLTHKMMLSCIYAVNTRFTNGELGLTNDDTYISYLPAAHLFE